VAKTLQFVVASAAALCAWPALARVDYDSHAFITSDAECTKAVAPTDPADPTFMCRVLHVVDDEKQGDTIEVPPGIPGWMLCNYKTQDLTPGLANTVSVSSSFDIFNLSARAPAGNKLSLGFVFRWIKNDGPGKKMRDEICPTGGFIAPTGGR
jgi:hypothetical protein